MHLHLMECAEDLPPRMRNMVLSRTGDQDVDRIVSWLQSNFRKCQRNHYQGVTPTINELKRALSPHVPESVIDVTVARLEDEGVLLVDHTKNDLITLKVNLYDSAVDAAGLPNASDEYYSEVNLADLPPLSPGGAPYQPSISDITRQQRSWENASQHQQKAAAKAQRQAHKLAAKKKREDEKALAKFQKELRDEDKAAAKKIRAEQRDLARKAREEEKEAKKRAREEEKDANMRAREEQKKAKKARKAAENLRKEEKKRCRENAKWRMYGFSIGK